MGRLRVSSISFLNTAPLMWDFEQGEHAADFEVSYTLPSACAEAMRTGEADIGIIPVVAYASIPDLEVIPGISIAARQAVRSILLVSKVPFGQIRSVAADTASRTSVALARVLFRRLHGIQPQFVAMPADVRVMLHDHDAALLIGDAALKLSPTQHLVYDLAEEWNRLTGKPFVFAFWAVRRQALSGLPSGVSLTQVFQQSRDHGLEPANLETIVRVWSGKLQLPQTKLYDYLTRSMDYSLDEENLSGLRLFFEYAKEAGVLVQEPPLRFLDEATERRSAGSRVR